MRLADRIFAAGSKADRERMAKDDPTPTIHADSIARSYYLNTQLEFGPRDYPFCRPGFRKCIVEWHESEKLQTADGLIDNPRPAQLGVKVGTFEKAEEIAHVRASVTKTVPTDTVVVIGMRPVTFSSMGLVSPPVTLFTFLNADGYPLDSMLCTSADFDMLTMGASEQQLLMAMAAHHTIPLMCFSFMNCRNVEMVDVTEQRAQPAKIRRRLRLPNIRSYTLKITAKTSQRTAATSDSEFDESMMAHHLCRGHFAVYSTEKPLFGNPKLVGRFWHPPHVRGNKKNGEVIKNYAIDTGREAS